MGINNAFTYNKQNFLFDTFAFTVQTTAPNETFALPLFSDGTYNFVCHWGDNSEDTITAYNQAEVTHTYVTPGTYTIQISGICTKFAFDNGGDCAKVRKILNVTDCGFTKLNFYGCSGLNEVKRPFRKLASLTSFQDGFRGCTSLTSIPTDLFKYNVNVSSSGFAHTFRGCTGLTSIPTDLFKYNVNVSSVGFAHTFRGCTGLTSIPTDLFKYNVNVSTEGFSSTFRGCTGLTSIPTDCFRYNINVSTYGFYQTFYGCTGLTSIPTDCFRYNINVSTRSEEHTSELQSHHDLV